MHFNTRAKAPLHYNVLRHLGELIDGVTGLIMLGFGRYGTGFNGLMCEKILRWQIDNRRKELKKPLDLCHHP